MFTIIRSTLASLALTAVAAISIIAQDWPQWRGPNRDGEVTSFNVPSVWPEQLERQWRVDVGLGYATPLLIGDRIYLFARQADEEVMQALDADSGKLIWRTAYPAPFTMVAATSRHGAGPKSTPAYANGRLFTLGMTNIVTAFDARTGRQIWQTAPTKAQPQYHTAMSPVVDGDVVIVHVGGPGDAALTALDVASGAARWKWNGDSPAYGSPIVIELGGTRQVVTFTHQNLVGVSVKSGELLWKRPFTTPANTTSQTPIVYRDMLIQAGRENGITAFNVQQRDGKWITTDVWRTDEVSLHMTNGVVVDRVLYGLSHLNSGQYFALDLDRGQVLWKSEPRQATNAAMVRTARTIFALEDDAELVVLRANRDRFDEVRRYEVADAATWAQPTLSRNRVYVKDVSTLTLWVLPVSSR